MSLTSRTQSFSHRAPSSTIHLLSDPFPVRLNGSTSMFTRAENLSTQREFIASSGRLRMAAMQKKK